MKAAHTGDPHLELLFTGYLMLSSRTFAQHAVVPLMTPYAVAGIAVNR